MKKYFVDNLDSAVSGKLLEILEHKVKELIDLKNELTLKQLKQKINENKFGIRSFSKVLDIENKISLIAEVKKASPSLGNINTEVDIVDQAMEYEKGGANAISILTDSKFFKGNIVFLQQIKDKVGIPVFRKDFIFDEYQVYESKLYGADAILLMATILKEDKLIELVELTHKLGLGCLVETHTKADMDKVLKTKAKVIGINARDLQTFDVDLKNIIDLAPQVPKDRIFIAESGVKTSEDVALLKKAGAQGILVGTTLMQADNLQEKIKELKSV
ncbi:indole-3-glycerol phosphate synthase TrpC [bacterium]|jgi:indole-3-glycerol phosphate synthase|nr:indole-3-glycerol phosphate synthase TrpC [Candidatus Parcubacteria bacterium]MBT3948917.1 indole-3-glycerol phosphate synthase TrpC [Candidatus Parcubacteria bacterium]MBT7088575.1 indole-3-glycerol phosphate synthase TrpC [bacterium]